MSVYVILKFMKRGFVEFHMKLLNEFYNFNITRTRVLDSIYCITREICLKLSNHDFYCMAYVI